MLALLSRRRVGRIVLVGGRDPRLDTARALGAFTVNYHDAGPALGGAVAEAGGGEDGFANVIEASGSPEALEAGLDLAAQGGKVLVVGDYGAARADFPWNRLLHRELELIGSNGSAGAWDEAVRLAVTGAVPLERLISRRLPASSFAEALDLARHGRDVIKVVMEWPR